MLSPSLSAIMAEWALSGGALISSCVIGTNMRARRDDGFGFGLPPWCMMRSRSTRVMYPSASPSQLSKSWSISLGLDGQPAADRPRRNSFLEQLPSRSVARYRRREITRVL